VSDFDVPTGVDVLQLMERHAVLLERVAKLERALEKIGEPKENHSARARMIAQEALSAEFVRDTAQEALSD
jgi:hypothetical protein